MMPRLFALFDGKQKIVDPLTSLISLLYRSYLVLSPFSNSALRR